MSQDIVSRSSTSRESAHAFRRAVLRDCADSDVSDLLRLADDLHDLIRHRRAGASQREAQSLPEPQVTATSVFLD